MTICLFDWPRSNAKKKKRDKMKEGTYYITDHEYIQVDAYSTYLTDEKQSFSINLPMGVAELWIEAILEEKENECKELKDNLKG